MLNEMKYSRWVYNIILGTTTSLQLVIFTGKRVTVAGKKLVII